MRFKLVSVVLLLLAGELAGAQEWKHAIVRVTSHGISGCVIESREGQSIILSCAHGFLMPNDQTRKAVVIDIPALDGRQLPPARGKPYLLALDQQRDVSLIVLPAGPLASIPLASSDQVRPGLCVSCGYDQMRSLPGPVVARATVAGSDQGHWLTREEPGHGRSGGPLIDLQRNEVIGIVQGYDVRPWNSAPGLYVSAGSIRNWMESQLARMGSGRAPDGSLYRGGLQPGVAELPELRPIPRVRVQESFGDCPNGQCPLRR